jgi:hypothetical protein
MSNISGTWHGVFQMIGLSNGATASYSMNFYRRNA